MQKSLEKVKLEFLHGQGKLGFVYYLEHIGIDGRVKWRERMENIIPDVGRDYLLTSSLLSGSQYGTWYIGLYKNAYSAVQGDTLATFLASAGESITYDTVGNARLTMAPDALSNGLWSNNGTPAEFDFTTQGETIRGGFITGTQTRQSDTGILLSSVLFPTPKILTAGETLRVKAGIQLVTA